MDLRHRPLLLVVLDGWGWRVETEHNAIRAGAGYFHELLAKYPNTLLTASGKEVGLPLGLMGNSEVGHLNLGAGQVVYQDVSRIDKDIEEGGFRRNRTLTDAMDRVRGTGNSLHLVGLVSDGGVHSSDHHLRQLLKLAAERGLAADRVCVHALLDGRDTPPRSGAGYLEVLERDIADAGVGRIASVIGRYFAMDRDTRWERVVRGYDLLTRGVGERHDTALAAVRASYEADVGDEFVEPRVIGDPGAGRLSDGDSVVCFNYRADRMRELCSALALDDFDGFERATRARTHLVTMTQYKAEFPFPVAYPPMNLKGILPEVASAHGLRQERIAETEKYAHVTFFFSGGVEAPYAGESRTLIPSPRVATYDLQPEMSAPGVRDAVVSSLRKEETDLYVVNFANADMVGHTGIYDAAEAAARAVDGCLADIVPEVTSRGGVIAITADHGNAELMWDVENDQPHTAHTTGPVPIVFCAEDLVGQELRPMGVLADVAPTLLELGGIGKPPEMDGVSLLQR